VIGISKERKAQYRLVTAQGKYYDWSR